VIHKYAGPNALASVWASEDGLDYVQVGELAGGQPGYFSDVWFDVAGLLETIHFVQVVRESSGPKTGTFVDALGAPLPAIRPNSADPAGELASVAPPLPVPEPGAAVLLGLGCLILAGRAR
jgi:hypothetical protein